MTVAGEQAIELFRRAFRALREVDRVSVNDADVIVRAVLVEIADVRELGGGAVAALTSKERAP